MSGNGTRTTNGNGAHGHFLTTDVIGRSPAFLRAVELARRFAVTRMAILLVGETGTGKEVLAHGIHRWSGRTGRLIDINCGALPADLLERELFGHRRGAFTGAVADGPGLIAAANRGTLFLDELPSLSLSGQARLLRVLEDGRVRPLGDVESEPVDMRVVSATQRDLGISVAEGCFREDLRHRIAGAIVRLPPLRERGQDVYLLAREFARLERARLDEKASEVLRQHAWPGNIRELRSAIERAAVLTDSGVITPALLCEAIDMGRTGSGYGLTRAREELINSVRRHGGDVADIAREFGVSRATIYRRLKKHRVRLELGPLS